MHRNVTLMIRCAMTAAMCAIFLTACASQEPSEENPSETEETVIGISEDNKTEIGEETGFQDAGETDEVMYTVSDSEDTGGDSVIDLPEQSYLAYANAVMRADGEGEVIFEDKLTLSTYWDGDESEAAANEERSILWALDGGIITVGELNATSTSSTNFEKLSRLNGLSDINTDISSEWGVNAMLLATDGGTVTVGADDDAENSFYANGDGTAGAYAGGTGTRAETAEAPALTGTVSIKNADFIMDGWNNHVADAAYGGYISLQNINAATGILGSYSIGRSSVLFAAYGNGTIDADTLNISTYGNNSNGAYVSDDGTITIKNSVLTAPMGSGLMMDEGGTLNVTDTAVSGQTGLRIRGGISEDKVSVFNNVVFTAGRDLTGYVTGEKALAAVRAWERVSGDTALASDLMGDPEMTLHGLCEEYGIGEDESTAFIEELSAISGIPYSPRTFLRNSVMDNTFYDYDNGCYLTDTDYSDVPYLAVGAGTGGYVSSALGFESADVSLEFDGCTFVNNNADDYAYAVASETGSAPVVRFNSSNVSGIIWNEGYVRRMEDGKISYFSSSLDVTFDDSNFTGSFADGSNGLWEVDIPVESEEVFSTADANDGDAENDEAADKYITVLNGNYYEAKGNWGITALFLGESVWTVDHDSYLGTLVIGPDAVIEAPAGYRILMTVEGQETQIAPGTYTGEVVLKVIPDEEN